MTTPRDPMRPTLAELEAMGEARGFGFSLGLPVEMPRLGGHLAIWGTGHWCDSGQDHEGACVCVCGVTRPYDQ